MYIGKIKKIALICLSFFLLLLWGVCVKAESFPSRVSVNIVQPNNQLDNSVRYFDLRMKPSEKQAVVIKLTNHTNSEIKMKISYNSAKTTSIGEIEYSENQLIEVDQSLKHDFSELVTGPNEVRLSPNQTTDVELDITMPEAPYDGWISGGVEFSEQEAEKTSGKEALIIEKSYIVGMLLSETSKKLPTDIQLNSVRTAQKNFQNAVVVSLSNINSNYVEELTTDVKVRAVGKKEVLLQERRENMRMAPNSMMEYPLYMEDMLLDEGSYVAEVSLESQGGYTATWEEEFKVSAKERKLLSETREEWDKEESPFNKIKMSLIIIIGILLVANFGVLYFNKKRSGKHSGK